MMIVTIQEIANKFGIPVDELVIKMSADKTDSVESNTVEDEKPKTVILYGLEWMTENLTGHGGKEANGNWYYTWDQATNAAEEIGNGWRLPTAEECEVLGLFSTWDENRKGQWVGKNKELFLPTLGTLNKVCISNNDIGYYWTRTFCNPDNGLGLPMAEESKESYNEKNFFRTVHVDKHWLHVYHAFEKDNYFSVRLVRDIK